MPHRAPSAIRAAAMVAALAVALGACSASNSAASSAPATTPAPASAAAPSAAAASAPAGSGPLLPSFNADTDLEAQLPTDFCNQKTMKYSFAGGEFLASDAEFAAVVNQLGRSAADVSVATAGVAGPECVDIQMFALRIKGANQGQFEQLFVASQGQQGPAPSKTNVAGKDVWTYTDSSGANYVYFKGDTAFGVTAPTAADAAKGLAALP
jgi:hypothetical protein